MLPVPGERGRVRPPGGIDWERELGPVQLVVGPAVVEVGLEG